MAATKRATATWSGNLTEGSGTVSTDSGVLKDQEMTWKARADEGNPKSSPEELIAAAHATCYAMAFSNELSSAGFVPDRLDVSSTVSFGPKQGGGVKVHSSALTVEGKVPGISAEQFQQIAEGAKTGCPVSAALAGNVEITLEAKLA
jgi:osmotically inducible protein OsmC